MEENLPNSEPLLDNKETSQPFAPSTTYQEHLISRCLQEWLAAGNLYQSISGSPYDPRVQAYRECRTRAQFLRHKVTNSVRVVSNACKLRWCPLCRQAKRATISVNVSDWISCQRHPKFLTLTLKHATGPLSEQVAFLSKSFTNLRRRSYFKKNVRGGIWFFQVKKSASDNLWHPHLHVLLSGNFLDRNRIKKLWRQITKTSMIIDIRAVKNPDKAAEYVARYAAGCAELQSLEHDERQELFFALHGKRICGTFGVAKDVSLTHPVSRDKSEWVRLGSWSFIVKLVGIDDAATAIYKAWMMNETLDPKISMYKTERLIYDDFEHEPERAPPDPLLF